MRRCFGSWTIQGVLTLCLLATTACSGDDESSGGAYVPWPGSAHPGAGPGASVSSPSMPPGAYCAAVAGWDSSSAQKEAKIVELVNARRARGASCGGESFGPAAPLVMDGALQCAARKHSKDMAEQGFFSHDSPNGDSPGDRMKAAGYSGRGWGENIAGGSATPEAAMEQWMSSPGHCSNIMSPNNKKIGVGYYAGGQWGHLWTQTFGS